MSLGEFEIIKKYFQRQAIQSSVVKSVGDDCAIVSHHENQHLVLSMDTLVAGRHFPEDATPYQIGSRALCTSLSDLAAMGAEPLYFTLGLTLPTASEIWLKEFSEGLFSIADAFSCDLIGGDTTRGPLTVTVQVHGVVKRNAALTRDAAQVGDTVYVTGTLGDGAAALAYLQHHSHPMPSYSMLDAADTQYLLQRFYAPRPQIAIGQQLLGYANAAIDISDGLLADAQHICEQSQVAIDIDVDLLPVSAALKKHSSEDCHRWALTGGDDYQLLFTVGDTCTADVDGLIASGDIDAVRIGRVQAIESNSCQRLVTCLYQGAPYNMQYTEKGYQHFAP